VLSTQDQDSERLSAKAWLEARSSEDSTDKARDAPPGREETTDGPDVHGAKHGEALESSEDSTRATSDAPSGKEVETRKPSAGASELELSEDSSEVAEDAPSGLRPVEDGSDAQEEESQVRSSENGTDKVRDVSLTRKVDLGGPDAHGSETGEVPESSEDSERVLTDALSGERADPTRLSAGTPRPLS